jgi:F0F1-type ATP synthase beta subunit
MQVKAVFRPENNGPDFELDARIDNVDMRAMNDLLRAHGKFDVASGVFSVYSEMRVRNGRIDGYVKPLFRDLVAYDSTQDEDKPFGQKMKEKVINVVGKVLKNRQREEVATVVPVSGPLQNPKAGTMETVLKLVENAFIKAILPGFEAESARVVRRR